MPQTVRCQRRGGVFDGSFWFAQRGTTDSSRVSMRGCTALDGEIVYTLCEAEIVIESWRRHYHTVRPHASLGYREPAPGVFVPALAAWPAAQYKPAPPACSAGTTVDAKLTFQTDHPSGAG